LIFVVSKKFLQNPINLNPLFEGKVGHRHQTPGNRKNNLFYSLFTCCLLTVDLRLSLEKFFLYLLCFLTLISTFDSLKKNTMDISAYLIELLRLHDCVIVPDFGGFVTNYRPAEVDLAGNSFNPPRKEIIFSAMLKKNDGLLVNHLSESEGIGYMEARLAISEFVEEAQSRLENGDTIVLPMIGSLKYDRNEKLIFEPDVKENLLLDSYGLEIFQFPQLKHPTLTLPKTSIKDKEAVRPVFNSRRVRTLALTIPVLLALLVIPVKKNGWDQLNPFNIQTSTTAPISLNTAPSMPVVQPSTVEVEEVKKVEQPATSTPKSSETPKVENKEAVKTQVPETSSKKYHLIGGCFKMKENADKLFNQLKSAGYQSRIDLAPSGNYIVTIQCYSTKEEAIIALKTLRDKEPKAGYWMSVK
jgi:cell division septation protein DedD